MDAKDRDAIAALIVGVFAFLALGILVVLGLGWASAKFWNLFAPGLFGMPSATTQNGIGFSGFLFCVRSALHHGSK